MRISTPRFEHHREALGIGEARPRISWLQTGPGTSPQTAYEVEVTDPETGAVTVHRVASPESILVPWPAEALPSRACRSVRVRVTGIDGATSDWSDAGAVETGNLNAADWRASFVAPVESDEDSAKEPRTAYLLRSTFETRGTVAQARLYSSALGVYEFEINGARVGQDILAPGWNSYQDRLRYQTYDVTGLVATGLNGWGARLADGWYRGRLGFNGGINNIYGDRTALLAQLHLRYEDGSESVHVTGPDWSSRQSEITSSGLLEGETVDARKLVDGWSESGLEAIGWNPVVVQRDFATLVAPDGPPVRETERLRPVSIKQVGDRVHLLDFGQNLVGRLRLTVSGERGRTITLRHAEILQDGRLCRGPLRHAAATDSYTLRGGGPESFEPRFTTHGFRYVEIENWPGEPTADGVAAVVVHTDMERTAWIETSHPGLNRLEENIRWGMRGNFVDVPTDCPQRDERLGYSGDLHVFAPTAATLYDSSGFVRDWLKDLLADQAREASGVPPVFSPDIPVIMPFPVPPGNLPAAGWSDAIIGVPWAMYRHFGDAALLELAYPGMTAWASAVEALAGPGRVWDKGFQFGDWLDPAAPPDNPSASSTENALVATAYFAHSMRTLAATAGVLGRAIDQTRYAALSEEISEAFRKRFVLGPGKMTSDTQAAYTLALRFDLLEGTDDRRAAGHRLADLVAESGFTVGTGFLATPHVCDALVDTGHIDEAYALLLGDTCPSWLYQVSMGATTVWERWDSLLPDGTVNPGEMTSFNHYAFGAVSDFIHRRVGGIAIEEPGHRTVRIAPRPGGGIDHAHTRHLTPYGAVDVSWRLKAGKLRCTATIPVGVEAVIDLPGTSERRTGNGTFTYEVSHG
ncbi:family 78 glycoside hydrolase catalytic domain [Arthrobacter sp. 2MCAF15]|uniref:family 78 glycoside hydrolase catalytic domain n=1 Tax=Arthrobacter sp. 2MCAF15 TaxID=3232984 RepID=UPI003F9029C5